MMRFKSFWQSQICTDIEMMYVKKGTTATSASGEVVRHRSILSFRYLKNSRGFFSDLSSLMQHNLKKCSCKKRIYCLQITLELL